MTLIEFVALGEAKPGGSKRAFRNPKTDRIVVTDDSGKGGKEWREAVKYAAREAYDGPLLTAALAVEFVFYVVRPKGHFGSGRNSGVLKASAPRYPAKRPDVLKLARAVEDALTGVLWKDDAQIVNERLLKAYGEPARVEVRVRDLDEVEEGQLIFAPPSFMEAEGPEAPLSDTAFALHEE